MSSASSCAETKLGPASDILCLSRKDARSTSGSTSGSPVPKRARVSIPVITPMHARISYHQSLVPARAPHIDLHWNQAVSWKTCEPVRRLPLRPPLPRPLRLLGLNAFQIRRAYRALFPSLGPVSISQGHRDFGHGHGPSSLLRLLLILSDYYRPLN